MVGTGLLSPPAVLNARGSVLSGLKGRSHGLLKCMAVVSTACVPPCTLPLGSSSATLPPVCCAVQALICWRAVSLCAKDTRVASACQRCCSRLL